MNGIICQAWNTQVSPSGKWIAGRYRKEFDPETKQRVDEPEYAAFYNTETETTVIVDDYGESGGRFVTDDGIGFIGIGTLAVSAGKCMTSIPVPTWAVRRIGYTIIMVLSFLPAMSIISLRTASMYSERLCMSPPWGKVFLVGMSRRPSKNKLI